MSRQPVSSRIKEQPLSLSRRFVKPVLMLVAAAVLVASLSACAVYKEGSLQVSQPGAVGPVRVHFALCTEPEPAGCGPNQDEGQAQYLLILRVPKGAAAPASITANPVSGGAPIAYSRNDEVGRAYEQLIRDYGASTGNPMEWPPAGTETVGYLSSVFTEEKGETREWVADADFGLPPGADGGTYGGPFTLEMATGWRAVNASAPSNRPVECYSPFSGEPADEEKDTFCLPNEEEPKSLGTSDLKIGAPAAASAFIGGKATIAFPIDFASTVSPPPNFALGATSTLPKAALKLSSSSYASTALDPTTHRAPVESRSVTVSVPKTAKPGSYEVTVSATAPQGGVISQVAKLKVTKPKLKFGGVKLNKSKGTATLAVKVPSAGTLTVAGKDVVKVKKKAKKAKTLKITIRAKGKTKTVLKETGKAKLKAKVSFKPASGIAVKKTKSVKLAVRP
jgi:hypothetical protein